MARRDLDMREVLEPALDSEAEALHFDEILKRWIDRTPLSWFREDHVAQRLIRERENRGWSQERLARELEKIGYSLPQSSISKIENPPRGATRRAITVDDAVALATVFDLALLELLAPPGRYNIRALEDFVEGPEQAKRLHEEQASYDARVDRAATEIVNRHIGPVVAAEVRNLFDALNATTIDEALAAIETVDPASLDEPVRYHVQFLRDVFARVEHVTPKRRSRGAFKGSARKVGGRDGE